MVTKNYLPSWLCDSSDGRDSSEISESSDSSDFFFLQKSFFTKTFSLKKYVHQKTVLFPTTFFLTN